MPRQVLLSLLLGLALLLAGCAAKTDGDEPTPEGDAAGNGANTSADNATMAPAANATNTTSSGDTSMPDDPSQCMSGMDMPGCTQAQAERYFAAQSALPPPPADKALPNVKIELNPQGDATQTATFQVPDNDTKQLLVAIRVNDSGQGAWFVSGSGTPPASDLKVTLKSGSVTKTITVSGIQSAGVDPANALAKGPYNDAIPLPPAAGWTITVDGVGQNVHLDVQLTERFWS